MTPTPTAVDAIAQETLGATFLRALATRDWSALESCFANDVQFRALVPPGIREATDRTSAAAYFRRWFGDADDLQLIDSDVKRVQDRLSLTYRFRAHEDQWYVVEQRAYCDVNDGQIAIMDLLCSGFQPAE